MSKINYTEQELKLIDFIESLYDKYLTTKNISNIVKTIKTNLKDYLKDEGLNGYVLPLSGGLDSAIMAALCEELPVRSMFIDIGNTSKHKKFADIISMQFKTDHQTMKITARDVSVVKKMMHSKDQLSKIQTGNIKARIRMMIAYNMAQEYKMCVLSTDNLSEHNMGFWTLHGDVGDIAPIQYINKGYELPRIAKYLKIPDTIIDQAPSDGLNVTKDNTDEAQLGANYKYIDACMMLFRSMRLNECGALSDNEFKKITSFSELTMSKRYLKIIDRHLNTKYKRSSNFKNVFQPYFG